MTPATDTDSTLAALVEATSNLNIHDLDPEELSYLGKAISKLGGHIVGRQAELGCIDTAIAEKSGAASGPPDLTTLLSHIERLDQKIEGFICADEKCIMCKTERLTAIWSDVKAIQDKLKSLRQLVSDRNPFAGLIEKCDLQELKNSVAALRGEIAGPKKH